MARALALVALLVLAGCAALEFERAADARGFELSGRIAVRYGAEAAGGQLRWRHDRGGDEMLISSPLGQGLARIQRDGEAVKLTTADGREYRAADAEELTHRVLGFRVPLAALPDWVQGRAARDMAVTQAQRDAQGRLVLLEQAGWRIEFLAYADDAARPTRLRLTYPALELRLVIAEWRTAPDTN
ncbi:MAG TPA: lipoprotein insertase outer membrane protein LolB [Burkholderiales bacterium]|nr:lipoprotein insertase outer membrane protein LolB [Burkholderiales bacterium]